MNQMPRILFLYATNNSGHQRAAQAISKSLRELSPDVQTSEIDFFTYHYPTIGPFISKMYLDLIRSVPHAWDFLYDNPNLATMTSELRRFFNFINIPKIYRVLRDYKPHAVVCTQAVPAGFIATEKEKGKISMPLFVAITDFVANPYWPDSQVDCYFVPDDEIRRNLNKRDIPDIRIKTTGIPIDNQFVVSHPKNVARQRLGLKPNTTVILITGGSRGLGNISDAVKFITGANRNYQIIVITGHNRILYKHLKKEYYGKKNVLVTGYSKNMSRLMDAADLIVSKPGGLTSAEAMAKGVPMIITAPLPGQEERNASYLIKHGVAERCDKIQLLPRVIDGLLHHPQKLKILQTRALNLGKPYASYEIANHLLKSIEQNS